MPTAVVANGSKATLSSGKATNRSKRPRVPKRRGRVQTESDDEIEREARSDSDTDEQSSLGSDSDSETASDDENHAGIVTPSTTQSPPPLDINGSSSSVKPEAIANGAPGPFVSTTDWAQLVADENATTGGDLPVIDFADMHEHAIPEPARPTSRPKNAQKHSKKASAARQAPDDEPQATPASKEAEQPPADDDEPMASSSRPDSKEPFAPRARGQSARQAYQERLQQDPAFVPRVGEFWGHDDRLLDKDLRSLSGWWRGRWHTRGRGRGAFNMRGRGGRGGFFPSRVPPSEEQAEAAENAPPPEDVPAIERAWTHDGFEEMKRREEQRKDEQRRAQGPAQPQAIPQRGAAFRGRGAFAPARGRGGIARGGHAAAPTNATGSAPAETHSDTTPRRPWFTMKPEKVWTKHADTFLYVESVFRPRPGQGPGIRVKLPGRPAQVLRSQRFVQSGGSTSSSSHPASHRSEESERQFVVKIPTHGPAKASAAPETATSADTEPVAPVAADLSIEEVFTVRPHAAPNHTPIDIPANDVKQPDLSEPSCSPAQNLSGLPDPAIQRQLELMGLGSESTAESDATLSATLEETLLRNPSATEVAAPVPHVPEEQSRPAPPALHPLQTSFSPVPQASPPYGSPYAYGPGLPPGIAMSHQGYPYEVATGRAVYLQPSAPPTMYTPRPIMHPYMGHPAGVPFVPGHMHHPSQEYISHPHTPPVNGFIDPSTGVPIFAPARQSSRIEIRAPSDRAEVKAFKPVPRPSGLRTAVAEADSAQADDVPDDVSAAVQSPPQQHVQPIVDPAMMAYAPYPQQYYYPDPNAYSAYMDMSPQVMQYELYPPHDQRAHQPIVFY